MASSAIPSATSTVQPSRAPSPKVSTTTTTPLTHIAHLASVHSSVLALFDTGKLAGFPLPNPSGRTSAQVWELQSRLGAGSSLAGYLRQAQGESASALISGPTLPLLLPSLAELPEPTAKGGRLVIHLALALPAADRPLDGPTSSLAQITALLPVIPESFAVIFSGSADEIVRNAHAIYEDEALKSSHVIHIIEGVSAGRELIRSPSTVASTKGFSVLEAFTYTGSNTATKVFVVPSSYTSTLLRTSGLPADVGVLTINALGPWPTSTLVEALPNAGKAVTELVVIEEASEAGQGTAVLKELVIGAVFGRAGTSSGKVPKITSIAIKGGEVTLERLRSSLGLSKPAEDKSSAKQTILYTPAASLLPRLLAKTFLSSAALETRLATLTSSIPTLDQSTLVIAPSRGIPSVKPFAATPVEGSSSLIVISTLNALTQTKSALASLAHGGSVLISLPGWDKASTAENLSVQDRKFLADKAARVFVVPSTGTGGEGEETALGLVAFFLLYAGVGEGGKLPEPVRAVVEAALGGVKDVIAQAEAALAEIDTLAFSTAGEGEEPVEEKRAELVLDGLTSFPSVAPSSAQDNATKPLKATWHNPALHLIFKEAFSSVTPTADAPPSVAALMPSQHDKTYLATVTENRRLTPASYDRNVFHLEISTAGTGLTYAVGEALGVHGWNDEQEVRDFLAWYGVDPSDVISVRLPSGAVETRTALQMFQQQVDLFGRPPKSFYAALVGKTSDREERRTLRFISAPEGSSMFKKWSEVETVTYADVLQRFPGLKEHLAIEDLVSLIGEIHPRHYSISSAQKFVGDSVHLLVVTVEWDGVSGKPRYGQCTRYLAGLRPGQQVTVSIKPSVMKLPPLDTQPIIMAGLGTGAAPFRAFIQHRAWQKSQGIEVGPLVYYFGSRYSSQEYLYGEEIEAYLRGGVLTHAGLAFSRDTSAKVYIQHKMLEDGALLSSLLTASEEKDKGYFYLCGPTWPVPDVYEALVGSIDGSKGVGRERAEAMIEEFKEAERYVLEVY